MLINMENQTDRYIYMIRILKWFLIDKLDKNPEYCWVNLYNWAGGDRSFWSMFFKQHSENDYKRQDCRKSNQDTPYAYCGKCEFTGRFYDK